MDELERQPQAAPPAQEPEPQADGASESGRTPEHSDLTADTLAPEAAAPDGGVDRVPEAAPAPEAELETAAEPASSESHAEVVPEAASEVESEPVAEAELETAAEPASYESHAEGAPEPAPEVEGEPVAEAAPEAALETAAESASSESRAEGAPEPAPEVEGGTDTEPPSPGPESEGEAESTEEAHESGQTISIEEWIAASGAIKAEPPAKESLEDAQLLAVLEACIYVAEEPLMPAQVAAALSQDPERIRRLLGLLMEEYDRPEHGIGIREVAGGYKMATKAEHHDSVRNFVKSLKAPLKLSLPALETLAVVAYKQPVTGPEIMDIRGVQGGGVLKTLLDKKLIVEGGRKNVIGKPILYKTSKEFLIQFGLKDLSELPTLKEFEEIRRMAFADDLPAESAPPPANETLEAEIPAATGPEAAIAPTTPEADAAEANSSPLESEPVPPAVDTPEPAPEPVSQAEEPAAETELSEPPDAPAQNEDGPPNSGPTE